MSPSLVLIDGMVHVIRSQACSLKKSLDLGVCARPARTRD